MWAIHKALAIALGVSVLIHVSFLLRDHYMPFTPEQIWNMGIFLDFGLLAVF